MNEVKNQGGTLTDEDVMENILMTLPESYSGKIFSIEKVYDSKKFTREQLFGTLTAFEMRKFGKEKEKSKTSFKSTKVEDDLDDESSEELEANFTS